MRVVILRLLTFKAENVVPEIYWGLGAIYVLSLLVCYSSILKSQKSSFACVAWILLVTCLPVIGILLYSFWSLISADYTSLRQLGVLNFKKSTLDKHGRKTI